LELVKRFFFDLILELLEGSSSEFILELVEGSSYFPPGGLAPIILRLPASVYARA
jgi:hypothetical protein